MNDKTRQIIEGLKIFQNYDHEIAATDDRITVNCCEKIRQEDHKRLLLLDWDIDGSDREPLYSIFV